MSDLPITLSGVDIHTNLFGLGHSGAEIGLLLTITPEDRNRYPTMAFINAALDVCPRVAVHVCGGGARACVMSGLISLHHKNIKRIQINGSPSCTDIDRIAGMYRGKWIITQHNAKNLHLLEVWASNHALLVDASGGRGESPAEWQPPVTNKPVGFAGGLGPDNLEEQLKRIAAVAKPGWWVDMESQLRTTDARGTDYFDVDKARHCIAIVQAFTQTQANATPA